MGEKVKLKQMDIYECIAIAKERKMDEEHRRMLLEGERRIAKYPAAQHSVEKLKKSGLFTDEEIAYFTYWIVGEKPRFTDIWVMGWRPSRVAKIIGYGTSTLQLWCREEKIATAMKDEFGRWIIYPEAVIKLRERRNTYEQGRRK